MIVPLALWRCQAQQVEYVVVYLLPSTYVIYEHYALNNLILNSETVLLGQLQIYHHLSNTLLLLALAPPQTYIQI